MPVYQYECEQCDEATELRRPVEIRDVPIECLKCKGLMQRVFTPKAVSFNIDFLREAGFFNAVRSDFEPDERTRPDLFQLEDRKFSLAGSGRRGNVSRTSYAEHLAAEKSRQRPAEKPAGPGLDAILNETLAEVGG
jgi:putative FmdB family regulatory protein